MRLQKKKKKTLQIVSAPGKTSRRGKLIFCDVFFSHEIFSAKCFVPFVGRSGRKLTPEPTNHVSLLLNVTRRKFETCGCENFAFINYRYRSTDLCAHILVRACVLTFLLEGKEIGNLKILISISQAFVLTSNQPSRIHFPFACIFAWILADASPCSSNTCTT